jgi:hypothetical protein
VASDARNNAARGLAEKSKLVKSTREFGRGAESPAVADERSQQSCRDQ